MFDRIGGGEVLNRAIEVFYQRVLSDNRVKHFFEGADMLRLRESQVAFLAFALGGPALYDGGSIREIHRPLSLTEEHFEVVCDHLLATLQELLVPGPVIDEVMSIVAAMHDDVLDL